MLKFSNVVHLDEPQVEGHAPIGLIANEPMLFSADQHMVEIAGGPLTARCWNAVRSEVLTWAARHQLNVVIDTRSHMLHPQWLRAIGGWHCDDFPRNDAGQPDGTGMNPFIRHWTVSLSSSQEPVLEPISNTMFLTSPLSVPRRVIDPARFWHSVDSYIRATKADIKRVQPMDGQWVSFGQRALHCVEPAQRPGWTFFMRVSATFRVPQNQIRRQVQVYLPSFNTSW